MPIEDARDKSAAAERQSLLGAAIVGVGGALDVAARFETVDGYLADELGPGHAVITERAAQTSREMPAKISFSRLDGASRARVVERH